MRTRLPAVSSLIVALLLGLPGLGCQKATSSGPNHDVPEPADLIATLSVDSASALLGRFAGYANVVSPGAGAALTEDILAQGVGGMVGVGKLSGIDYGKPMSVLLLDPKKHKQPVVVLATAKDAKQLQDSKGAKVTMDGDRAVIGPAAEVDAVAAYAFGVLASRKAPSAATVSFSPAKVMSLYKTELDAFRAQMNNMPGELAGMSKLVNAELDIVAKIADQTDRADIIVDAHDGDAVFEIALVPRAGTAFDQFNRGQKVFGADKLLALLPAQEHPSMVMGAHYEMALLRGPMLDLMSGPWEQITGSKLDAAKWNAFLDGFNGDLGLMAASVPGGGFAMDEIFSATDGAKSAAQLHDLLAPATPGPHTADIMGIKLTWEAHGPTATHDGVSIEKYTMTPDYSSMNEAARISLRAVYGEAVDICVAGFDKTLAITLGPNGADRLGVLIDGVRKGSTSNLSPAVKAEVAGAQARKSSAFFYMDVLRYMAMLTGGNPGDASAGMSVEFSFEDGAARFRFIYPAATAQALVSAIARGGR